MRYDLTIPETAPSPNVVMRLHWAKRKQLWDRYGRFIMALVCQQGALPQWAPDRARVTITRIGAREMDPDNLVGAHKPVIDGLTRNKLIADDSSKHIELVITQRLKERGSKARTLVTVEAI